MKYPLNTLLVFLTFLLLIPLINSCKEQKASTEKTFSNNTLNSKATKATVVKDRNADDAKDNWFLDKGDKKIKKTLINDGMASLGPGELMLDGSPSGLSLYNSSSSQIGLFWSIGSTNHYGHIIERSTDGINYAEIETTSGSITSYWDVQLIEGTEYYYRIRAYKGTKYSDYSNNASAYTRPSTPNSLKATTVSPTQINLVWTMNSSNQDGTAIERSPNGITEWDEITRVIGTTNVYNDTGLGIRYYYRVRAYVNGNRYSPYASVATNIIPGPVINHFYIDPTGSDDTGDGSLKKPY